MSDTPSQLVTRPLAELFGRHTGYGFAGLGVSTAIGNYTETDADLTFPDGLLGLLDWNRTYNSLSSAAGSLGRGWTTSLSASLDVSQAGGPVQLHDVDGRVLPFTSAAAGGFTRPQDLDADLTRAADGTFTLTYNSGHVWSFDGTGRLTGTAFNGQTVSLSYAAGGQLTSAAHSSGRRLSFSYASNGRLTSAAADDGRTVSYGYDSDGTLQSVTLPGSGQVSYASTGGVVTRITSADGNLVVANSYGADGRVSGQDFPAGGSAAFGYDTGTGVTTVTTTPSSGQLTFQADANGRMTQVTGADGNIATFGYDADGRLTQAATPAGAQLTRSYDARGDVLSSTFGGATTEWSYDDVSRVTRPGSVARPRHSRTWRCSRLRQ